MRYNILPVVYNMSTDFDTHFNTLDVTIASEQDHKLALRYAPRIRFDANEPFFPSAIGYTVFRATQPSPSFPRTIEIVNNIAFAIEYAVWWDWDIGHLYELEHIWVYVDHDGNLIDGDASWHGGFHRMVTDDDQLPIEDGRLTVYSEPGKHAFAPMIEWQIERKQHTLSSCSTSAGKGGVLVTPLFEGIIQDRNPLNNRLVHTYCEQHTFEPSYDYSRIFDLEEAVFVPWDNLFKWIPSRVHWWAQELRRTIKPSEQRVIRIAHRGASAYAQENSASSLSKAVELQSDMVELDVRTTADDIPIITHDSSLKRVYGIDGAVSDFTLEELQSLSTEQEPIMTFEDAVKLCRELRLGIYLDIKDLSWAAAETMFKMIDDQHFMSNIIFGSFRPDMLAEIKAYRPKAVTSILFNSVHIDPVALAQAIGADYVHPCWERRAEQPHKLLTPQWMERVRAAELGIVCWHEERPSEIAALQALGVDAICSDMPELLVKS